MGHVDKEDFNKTLFKFLDKMVEVEDYQGKTYKGHLVSVNYYYGKVIIETEDEMIFVNNVAKVSMKK